MKRVILFLAAATLFVGCNKESNRTDIDKAANDISNSGKKHIEILVSTESTKATLPAKTVTFGAGDEIAVIGTKNNVAEVITLSVSNVSSEGITFSADIDEDYEIGEYAYYPASIATTTELNINWPTSIDGAKVQVPMIAKVDIANNTAVFKNLGVIAKIALTNVPSGATTLEFNAAEAITGPYTVSYSADVPTATAGTLTGSTITASISGDGTYYIPLPPKTYEGFQFAMTDGDAYYFKQKTHVTTAETPAITLNRNSIANFGTLDYDIDEIEEWYIQSDVATWDTQVVRLIKIDENGYQAASYVPESNPWFKFYSPDYNVTGTESSSILEPGKTCYKPNINANNELFKVSLWYGTDSNWYMNYESIAGWDHCWSVSDVSIFIKGDFNGWQESEDYKLTKYDSNNNMIWYRKGIKVTDNTTQGFKFYVKGSDWDWWIGVAEGTKITDAKPYNYAASGEGNILYTLTQGTYDVYFDVQTYAFMFVKQ